MYSSECKNISSDSPKSREQINFYCFSSPRRGNSKSDILLYSTPFMASRELFKYEMCLKQEDDVHRQYFLTVHKQRSKPVDLLVIIKQPDDIVSQL